MAYKAIILGASGLVGGNLLHILLDSAEYDEVLVLLRKELPVKHKKLVQLIVNFDELDKYAGSITGHAVFCCLGTTRSKTPDMVQYRKIDHDYPLQVAQLAHKNGIKHYHLVSAIGANAKSSNFYLKMKGETEDDLQKVGLDTLHIYQPSLLVGDRKEPRLAERFFAGLMKLINPLMMGGLKKYRSIRSTTVAHAMYKKSLEAESGTYIHITDK